MYSSFCDGFNFDPIIEDTNEISGEPAIDTAIERLVCACRLPDLSLTNRSSVDIELAADRCALATVVGLLAPTRLIKQLLL